MSLNSVLAACSICVLKTINYIEVLKYLYIICINGLSKERVIGPT